MATLGDVTLFVSCRIRWHRHDTNKIIHRNVASDLFLAIQNTVAVFGLIILFQNISLLTRIYLYLIKHGQASCIHPTEADHLVVELQVLGPTLKNFLRP